MNVNGTLPFGLRIDPAAVRAANSIWLTLSLAATIVMCHFLRNEHDSQRLMELVFFIAAGVLIVMRVQVRGPASIDGVLWRGSLATFFVLGAGSSLLAYSPRHAYLEVLHLLLLSMLAIGVAYEMSGDYIARLTVVLKMLAAGSVVYLFQIGVVWASGMVMHEPPQLDSFAMSFSNYRFLNHMQTISLPLLVLLSCIAAPANRKYWLALAACWAVPIFLLSGRGTILGLAVGCAVALLVQRGRAREYCKRLALVGLTGFALNWIFFVAIPHMAGLGSFTNITVAVERTAKDPTSLRFPLWDRALEMIASHPLLGAGPLHYAHYAVDINNGAHPHNWPLQIGAEWGLPALLFLCIAIAFAGRILLKSSSTLAPDDTQNHLISTAFLVTGGAIIVDGLVSGLIVMPVSQLLIVLYIGCAGGWVLSLTPPAKNARVVPKAAVATMWILVGVALAVAVAPDLERIISGKTPAGQKHSIHYDESRPRFWRGGYF